MQTNKALKKLRILIIVCMSLMLLGLFVVTIGFKLYVRTFSADQYIVMAATLQAEANVRSTNFFYFRLIATNNVTDDSTTITSNGIPIKNYPTFSHGNDALFVQTYNSQIYPLKKVRQTGHQ